MKYLNLTGLARVWEHIKTYIDNALEDIPVATTEADGLMSSEDKSKLDGMDSSELDAVVEFDVLDESSSEEIDTSMIKQETTSKPDIIAYVTALKTFLALNYTEGIGYTMWSATDSIPASTAYGTATSLGVTPVTGKLYVHTEGDAVYRWSGSALVKVGSSLALGETSTTAFAGNRGVTLEKWKSTGTNVDEISDQRRKFTVQNGLITAFEDDDDLESTIDNYLAHTKVTTTTAGIKKITVSKGAVASVADITVKDIAALNGSAVVTPTNIPMVYTGFTGYVQTTLGRAATTTEYVSTSYYVNTSGDPNIGYNSASDSQLTPHYTDNYFLPTLKVGDIVVGTDGIAWIVIKALSGTTPVQVAKLGASS